MKTPEQFLEELKRYLENTAIPACEKSFAYYEGEKYLKEILEAIEEFQSECKTNEKQ